MVDSKVFPKELSTLLYEKVGFSDKELADYFTLGENEKEWILKVKQWLEPKSYGAMRELCREKGGAYNPKPPTFFIPKGREVSASQTLTKEREVSSVHQGEPKPTKPIKGDYDLKASVQLLPQLKKAFPIIRDDKGVRVDGHHRFQIDKDWPSVTIPFENENQRKIARFVANFCRRNVTEKEKRDFVTSLKIETGLPPKELANIVPMSYSWIMKYLPDEYKEKAWEKEHDVSRIPPRVIEQEGVKKEHDFGRPTVYQCAMCGMSTIYPEFYEGDKPLCGPCSDKVQREPELIKKLKEKPSPPPKITKTTYEKELMKPTWPERKQMMHPKVSQMENRLTLRFNEVGLHPEVQVEFCLVKTKVDWYFRDKKKVLHLDHVKTHKDRENRDAYLRGRLKKIWDIDSVGFTYADTTKKTEDELFVKMMKELGEEERLKKA